MKYVKLTAKVDTWFVEGNEVYDYDSSPENPYRVSLDDYEKWALSGQLLVRGRHIPEGSDEAVWDGELCMTDEFNVEIVDEKFEE